MDGSFRELADQMEPKDHAQLQAAVAYVLNSAYIMYLRARGVATKTHPVKHDLKRIHEYFEKIKKHSEAAQAAQAAAAAGLTPEEAAKLQRERERAKQGAKTLNVEVAERLIAHGTGVRRASSGSGGSSGSGAGGGGGGEAAPPPR